MKTRSMTAAALMILALVACDSGGADDPTVATAPDGFSHYIVYVAGGTYDPNDPEYPPVTLDEIQREIWGFGDSEIAAFEADAKAFYVARFGIDVDDPANADRVLLTTFIADPRARYRVGTMSGYAVPAEGWAVSDGALNLVITDPDGYELGGDFAGQIAPAGAFISYGRYDIHMDTGEQVPIYFESVSPIVIDPFGLGAFLCDLSSEKFGQGLAYGAYQLGQRLDGQVEAYGRNVLTFQ